MIPDLSQHHSDATPTGDESHVWPPPRYSQRDRWTRLLGGTIFGALLVVWLIVYWPNVTMRFVSLGLLIAIVWMVTPVIFDNPPSPHRQIVVDADCLRISSNRGDTVVVACRDVASAQWRQDEPEKFGLWLFDSNGQVLAHLDRTLLPNQVDAKAFVKWARRLTTLPFEVRWTQV